MKIGQPFVENGMKQYRDSCLSRELDQNTSKVPSNFAILLFF